MLLLSIRGMQSCMGGVVVWLERGDVLVGGVAGVSFKVNEVVSEGGVEPKSDVTFPFVPLWVEIRK